MRVLSKSWFLILLYMCTSLLILLTSAISIELFNNFIGSSKLNLHMTFKSEILTNDDVYRYFSDCSIDLRSFRLNTSSAGREMINLGESYDLNLLEGRNFNLRDYTDMNNVIILSEREMERSYKEDNKIVYWLNNNPYEVIGTYSDTLIEDYGYHIVNMLAKANIDSRELNSFYIQTEDEQRFIDDITGFLENIDKNVSITISSPSFTELILSLIIRRIDILGVLSTVILLVIINTGSAIYFWLSKRKRELAVRLLCGSTRGRLTKMLLGQFGTIVTTSYVLSLVMYSILVISDVFSFLPKSIKLEFFFIAYFLTIIFGIGFALSPIRKYTKISIDKLLR